MPPLLSHVPEPLVNAAVTVAPFAGISRETQPVQAAVMSTPGAVVQAPAPIL
ncbi:hypothetical protein D3C74_300930 [compost metagenome]